MQLSACDLLRGKSYALLTSRVSVGESLSEGVLPCGRLAEDLFIESFLHRPGNDRAHWTADLLIMVAKRVDRGIQSEVSGNLVVLSISIVPFGGFIDRLGLRDKDRSQDMLNIID